MKVENENQGDKSSSENSWNRLSCCCCSIVKLLMANRKVKVKHNENENPSDKSFSENSFNWQSCKWQHLVPTVV